MLAVIFVILELSYPTYLDSHLNSEVRQYLTTALKHN